MIEIQELPFGIVIILKDKEDFEDRYLEDDDEGGSRVKYFDVADILEASRYLGNGWDDLTNNIGLTEAPAIGYNISRDDEGDFEIHEDSKVYSYNNYMIKNPWQVMYEEGHVFFTVV
jgi:hypothetical protein